jgi:hypothetical protein
VVGSCEEGNGSAGYIQLGEKLLASREGLCPMELVTDSLLTILVTLKHETLIMRNTTVCVDLRPNRSLSHLATNPAGNSTADCQKKL